MFFGLLRTYLSRLALFLKQRSTLRLLTWFHLVPFFVYRMQILSDAYSASVSAWLRLSERFFEHQFWYRNSHSKLLSLYFTDKNEVWKECENCAILERYSKESSVPDIQLRLHIFAPTEGIYRVNIFCHDITRNLHIFLSTHKFVWRSRADRGLRTLSSCVYEDNRYQAVEYSAISRSKSNKHRLGCAERAEYVSFMGWYDSIGDESPSTNDLRNETCTGIVSPTEGLVCIEAQSLPRLLPIFVRRENVETEIRTVVSIFP